MLCVSYQCYIMETRVNKLLEDYLVEMKKNIKTKLTDLNIIHISTDDSHTEKLREFMEYVFEYPKLVITKEDLVIPKKSNQASAQIISPDMQCTAKRFDGVQCTRKKKKGCDLCGTHVKLEMNKQSQNNTSHSMEVAAEDVNGIIYYIDKQLNVYHTEDILEGKHNPRIIGKAVKHGDSSHTIDLIEP
jgi:hypothetical protein